MPRFRRTGFLLGLAAAAGATAASVFGVAALTRGDARAAPGGCGPVPEAAATVVAEFMHTAVLRVNQICSYDLVTGNVRQGLSRAEWAHGDIPVVPYPTALPQTLRIEKRAKQGAAGERASFIVLEAADLRPAVFELVLVRTAGRWLVDYWGPAYAPGAPFG